MEYIYRIVAVVFTLMMLIANYSDNKIVGNVGAIGFIVASLIFVFWKNKTNQKHGRGIIFLLVLGCILSIGVVASYFVTTVGAKSSSEPISGIENYDKQKIVQDNYSDMDSLFLIFPDDTEKIVNGDYISNTKTNLIDTQGYIILDAYYEEDDYLSEVERISGISYDLKDVWKGKEDHIVQEVRYDDAMYKYPAYIASDGYCGGYEYALADKENNRIIYVHLSYPNVDALKDYSDFLKNDAGSYKKQESTSKENFTIYAHEFREGYIAECSYE